MKYRITHYPQVPCKPYYVYICDLAEALKIRRVLCHYDLFQYDNGIKPDYCNINDLETKEDGGEWESWYDPETDESFGEWARRQPTSSGGEGV